MRLTRVLEAISRFEHLAKVHESWTRARYTTQLGILFRRDNHVGRSVY